MRCHLPFVGGGGGGETMSERGLERKGGVSTFRAHYCNVKCVVICVTLWLSTSGWNRIDCGIPQLYFLIHASNESYVVLELFMLLQLELQQSSIGCFTSLFLNRTMPTCAAIINVPFNVQPSAILLILIILCSYIIYLIIDNKRDLISSGCPEWLRRELRILNFNSSSAYINQFLTNQIFVLPSAANRKINIEFWLTNLCEQWLQCFVPSPNMIW